ncbi:MAG: alpha/beta fold hydrolase [Candidatus Puniceispirillales bacterium]
MEITTKSSTVNGIKWHWAEAGDGDPVILLHGIPESWKCWKHQIPKLATQFKVYAIDLKGYGLSDKKEGDYSMNNVASEILDLLDHLKISSFRLAGHDWGVAISDNIIDQAPERVERYIRCCLSLHAYDPRNSLHHQWNSENPDLAARLMNKPDAYVRVWFESSCKPDLIPDEKEIKEIVDDFSHQGTGDAVPRYFRDIPKNKPVDLSKFTMPILYIHGEHDPRQPIEYCHGMEDHLPGLQAILVLDSGHFITRERPKQTTDAMMWFFNSMLGSGLKIFDRSKELGLPTKPTKLPLKSFGVNSVKFD